jgi:hypothetical protein
MTWGIAMAALAVMFVPAAAWSCDVAGRVVCARASATDPVIPLANVQLTFTDGYKTYPNQWAPLPPTDASGAYAFRIDGSGIVPGYWTVTLNLSQLGGSSSLVLPQVYIPDLYPAVSVLPDFEVSATDLPMCGPSQSACDLTGVPQGALACEDRPWGNPRSECARFGNFVPVGDGWTVDGQTIRATIAADFAIVKAGRACYAVTQNVSAGDSLAIPLAYGISHVTYCGCPAQ